MDERDYERDEIFPAVLGEIKRDNARRMGGAMWKGTRGSSGGSDGMRPVAWSPRTDLFD